MATTRVTPYLGGTGRDNRGKINVHATLKRVSIGADSIAQANLQVFGNSYANVAESNLNFSVKTLISNTFTSYSPNADFQIAKSGELKFNLYSNNSTVRQDFTSTAADFSIIVSGGPQPNVTWLAGTGLVNAYAQVNEFIHTNNVYVRGNLFVTGTTTINNVIQTIEVANTQSANAYYLTKAATDISMSNGWTFSGTNVAHFAYTRKYMEIGADGSIFLPSNTIIAANGSIGIGTRVIGGANLHILSSSGSLVTYRRAGNNGHINLDFSGIGNGDGIVLQHAPTTASATTGYQWLTFDGTRQVQAVTVNRFGNVSIGSHSAAMANLQVTGNVYVSGNSRIGTSHIDANGFIGINHYNPRTYMHIKGTWVTSIGLAQFDTSSATQYSGFTFGNNGTTKSYMYWDDTNSSTFIGGQSTNTIIFGHSATSEWVRIDSGGNLAVGTGAAGSAKLHVSGNAYVTGNLAVVSNVYVGNGPSLTDGGLNVQGSGVIQAWNSGLAGATRRTWGIATEQDSVGDWQLRISTAANTKPSVARVTVTAMGNVGVGIGNPTSNLQVSGNAAVSGALIAGGEILSSTGLSGGYITVGGTGFYTSGGTYLFRNSAQNAGGVMNVNEDNAYKFFNRTGVTYANIFANSATLVGDVVISGNLTATSKSFLIEHPTTPGKQLQYGSLEGPEHGVYHRGKLRGNNFISLPYYWSDLVLEDSVTINLTSVGIYQQLWANMQSNCITVNNGEPVWCDYVVHAERKDIAKLEVEI